MEIMENLPDWGVNWSCFTVAIIMKNLINSTRGMYDRGGSQGVDN